MMLGTLVPAATAVAALGLWPMWHTVMPVALVTSAEFAAFFAVGVVLMAEPGQAPAGIAMMLFAALLVVGWANEWGVGPAAQPAGLTVGLVLKPLGGLLALLAETSDHRLCRGGSAVLGHLLQPADGRVDPRILIWGPPQLGVDALGGVLHLVFLNP